MNQCEHIGCTEEAKKNLAGTDFCETHYKEVRDDLYKSLRFTKNGQRGIDISEIIEFIKNFETEIITSKDVVEGMRLSYPTVKKKMDICISFGVVQKQDIGKYLIKNRRFRI